MALEILILSDIRFVREGLADVLGHNETFRVAGVAADITEARGLIAGAQPRVVLIDTALPDGLTVVGELRDCAHDVEIVAFALRDIEEEVLAWAAAGISGYIPRNTPLSGLVGALKDVVHGQQTCPTQIASSMLRWIAQRGAAAERQEARNAAMILTVRETEVAHLIGAGLSNKEIARRLSISVATTKSHVHNVLAKLKVERRTQAADYLRVRHGYPPGPSST